ncbi:methylthioribose kinase [Actibacterium mucosum KCTC 23349]|uniref:S-methyl-5-thioribose kinase n=1 Tax=Actibacterium mucosum KCTC 23349 TaxID=1454373 RepID=A0A037ZJX5_9RHOB|nr:S-methyl-5-thioribose kinase [Actibacterium mucosum]KAJ55899.1 methylthioribose kinase [Actibacterium mucosum KCTC 23349]
MSEDAEYEALTVENLIPRLGQVSAVTDRVGGDPAGWSVTEVGDGNLNLVFIVTGPDGAVIVKQALPYVRLVGDSWPLPLYRAFYEFHALTRQATRDPGSVPEIYHFDEVQALIVMEYLSPHVILRTKLIAGEQVAGLGQRLGEFCARTAFRGSELCMKSAEKKADLALFSGSVEIPAITEALIFRDPYFAAEMNHHTKGLDPVVAHLRSDVAMKEQVQHLFRTFSAKAETMCHGDLHSGSAMCTDTQTRVIDPEFVFYGPMGFDLGMLVANYLMAYFSQPAHRSADSLNAYQEWILQVIIETVDTFMAEFKALWAAERTGMLYDRSQFEDQGHSSDNARDALLDEIWSDALGFCGIEMHRRILSLAHNADFEAIDDVAIRAPLEARNLMMGRDLILRRDMVADVRRLSDIARQFNGEDFL